jgi:hypothetical protein
MARSNSSFALASPSDQRFAPVNCTRSQISTLDCRLSVFAFTLFIEFSPLCLAILETKPWRLMKDAPRRGAGQAKIGAAGWIRVPKWKKDKSEKDAK